MYRIWKNSKLGLAALVLAGLLTVGTASSQAQFSVTFGNPSNGALTYSPSTGTFYRQPAGGYYGSGYGYNPGYGYQMYGPSYNNPYQGYSSYSYSRPGYNSYYQTPGYSTGYGANPGYSYYTPRFFRY